MKARDFSAEITAVNLHRIFWVLVATTLLNVAILVFNLVSPALQNRTLAGWQGVDITVSLALLAVTRWLQAQPERSAGRPGFIVAYLLLAFGFMDKYYFVLLQSHGHTAAYVLGVITVGVLLLLPPRLFIGILLANHAVFCALLLTSGQDGRVTVLGISDGTCAVLISALASWFFYRARRNDFVQQCVIADRNQELQLRNEEMGEVMAITAHDLRSPLQGVKHLLDFATPLGGSERLTAALQTASRSCAEMLALIGRLLDAHAVRSECADGDLREPFESATARAQPIAIAKNIRVHLRSSPAAALASFEPGALARVLDNLLGNAIKFSPPGSAVTLELRDENGVWCAKVRDEGPGIAEDERESIFQKFQRADGAAEAGNGLGLFIVRKLMEAMRGSVTCVPGGNGGAVFRLHFAPAESVV